MDTVFRTAFNFTVLPVPSSFANTSTSLHNAMVVAVPVCQALGAVLATESIVTDTARVERALCSDGSTEWGTFAIARAVIRTLAVLAHRSIETTFALTHPILLFTMVWSPLSNNLRCNFVRARSPPHTWL